MDVRVELNAGDCERYEQRLFARVARDTIAASGRNIADDATITISVACVVPAQMQRLNAQLRGKNCVTDVLSIGDYSDEKDIEKEQSCDIFLGEIILCYNYIQQVAHENGSHEAYELFRIYAHGILHLLGFAHSRKMFAVHDAVAKTFCKEQRFY